MSQGGGGGVQRNRVFSMLSQISPRPIRGDTALQILTHFSKGYPDKWKWNESSFRQILCTYRLNWARKTSWLRWAEWGDTALQTQDSKFQPWRSETEQATSLSRRLPTILSFTSRWGRTAETGTRTPSSSVKGSSANPYPRAPAQLRKEPNRQVKIYLQHPFNCQWIVLANTMHPPNAISMLTHCL